MSQVAANDKKYAYGNYVHWPNDERWELTASAASRQFTRPKVCCR